MSKVIKKRPGTSNQWLFRLENKFRKSYLIKFDNIKWFLSYFKITSVNLCKPVHDITNSSTFTCPFESRKFGRDGEKLQKCEYLESKKSFLDETKNIFHSF